MGCVCESPDSFSPSVSDPEFYNAYAQIEDGQRSSYFVVYDSATDDEVKFRINYSPKCGRRLAERGER